MYILGGIFESNLSCIPPNPWIDFYNYHYKYSSWFNPTLSSPLSSSTFPRLQNQSDTYRKEEPENYHNNSKGDIAE